MAASGSCIAIVPTVNRRAHGTGLTRFLVAVLVFVVLLAVPVAAPPPVEAASLKDQIASAKERQESLNKSIANSQKIVDQLKKDQAETRNDLVRTQDDLSKNRADQVAVRKRIQKVKDRLDRIELRHAELVDGQRQTVFTLSLLEQELAAGEDDLKARREAFGRRIVEAYRSENTPLLDQIMTAESFSDVLTDTSAYLSYGDQDAQLAEQIVQDQQALDNLRLLTTSTRLHTDQLRRDTLETQAQVEELKESLREAKKRLEQIEKRTEKLLERQKAHMQTIIKNKAQARKAIQQQINTRNALRRSIAAKLAQYNRKATATFGVRGGSGSGRFAWPTTGNISQPYGCTGYYVNPPRGSCAHFHDGIDIANSAGTPVRAAANGVVVMVGWNPWEYNPAFIVVIAHGGGVSTLYAHMQPTYSVRAGQTVKRGQLVGRMGSTGGSFGSHLHFEVWAGGDWQPVNPYAYL
jgi:murein DD-endopeptidase MepM/ murein hydrolase activator NlpD